MEEKIYEVGMALFKEKGYVNTTLVEIAAIAGISTRTLYKYFPAKENILFKFSKDHVKLVERFAKKLPAKMDIKEKILSVMLKDIGTITQSEYNYLHQTEKFCSVTASHFEIENMIDLEKVYQKLLEEEQKRRQIENGGDCSKAAIVVVGIYRQVTDRLFHYEECFNYKLFRESYKECLDTLWTGIEKNLLSKNN